jgi:hypothetical protein
MCSTMDTYSGGVPTVSGDLPMSDRRTPQSLVQDDDVTLEALEASLDTEMARICRILIGYLERPEPAE